MSLAGIITSILIYIHPNYKKNTDEVMSFFLNHCSVYLKITLCRLHWVGNHLNVSLQIVDEVHIQIQTVTHLGGYWEMDWGNVTCVQGMYIHYSITFNAHKLHKDLKTLSHDSHQRPPNALNHRVWIIKHHYPQDRANVKSAKFAVSFITDLFEVQPVTQSAMLFHQSQTHLLVTIVSFDVKGSRPGKTSKSHFIGVFFNEEEKKTGTGKSLKNKLYNKLFVKQILLYGHDMSKEIETLAMK